MITDIRDKVISKDETKVILEIPVAEWELFVEQYNWLGLRPSDVQIYHENAGKQLDYDSAEEFLFDYVDAFFDDLDSSLEEYITDCVKDELTDED